MPILKRSKVLTAMRVFYPAAPPGLSRDATDRKDRTVRLTLFQRDDCHLCDQALDVLASARSPEFDSVFIDGDDVLENRYGIRVPVLRREDDGAELDWPFDAAGVAAFLAAGNGPAA